MTTAKGTAQSIHIHVLRLALSSSNPTRYTMWLDPVPKFYLKSTHDYHWLQNEQCLNKLVCLGLEVTAYMQVIGVTARLFNPRWDYIVFHIHICSLRGDEILLLSEHLFNFIETTKNIEAILFD